MKSNHKLILYLAYAITMLLATVIVHILTYFNVVFDNYKLLMFLLVFGTIFCFVPALKSMEVKSGERFKWKTTLSHSPKWIKTLLIVTTIYVFFNFFFSVFVLSEGGLTTNSEGEQYFLENHGNIVRQIDINEFNKYNRYSLRSMSGHPIIFQFISIAILITAIRRK